MNCTSNNYSSIRCSSRSRARYSAERAAAERADDLVAIAEPAFDFPRLVLHHVVVLVNGPGQTIDCNSWAPSAQGTLMTILPVARPDTE